MKATDRLDVQVIVVGAGPVGMFTSLVLLRRGVDIVLIEQGPDEVRSEWRGSTLHPPTLQILDEMDLVEPVLSGGVRVETLKYRDLESDLEAAFDYSLLEGLTPFPFRVQYEQYKLVRQLREALVDRDAPVHYETEVIGVSQSDDHVVVTLMRNGEKSEMRAGWLIGADGAHSSVRRSLDIDFPGFTYEFQSLVAATRFPFEEALPNIGNLCYWSGPRGRFSLIRTPDIWRTALTTGTRVDDDVQEVPEPHPDFVANIELLLGGQVDPSSITLEQHQLYRSHQRVADTFRQGRVLLAGDAAHISSTTGGMGLNSGIHDAWALAKALVGDDVDAELEHYAKRRRQVALEAVQPATTRNRQGADLETTEDRLGRLRELVRQAGDVDAARSHLFTASMLGMLD